MNTNTKKPVSDWELATDQILAHNFIEAKSVWYGKTPDLFSTFIRKITDQLEKQGVITYNERIDMLSIIDTPNTWGIGGAFYMLFLQSTQISNGRLSFADIYTLKNDPTFRTNLQRIFASDGTIPEQFNTALKNFFNVVNEHKEDTTDWLENYFKESNPTEQQSLASSETLYTIMEFNQKIQTYIVSNSKRTISNLKVEAEKGDKQAKNAVEKLSFWENNLTTNSELLEEMGKHCYKGITLNQILNFIDVCQQYNTEWACAMFDWS